MTLVSLSLVRDIGINKVEGSRYVLSSFTKDRINTLGEVRIELEIAGVRAQHRCIVVDSHMEYDILLGMDFVSTHKLSIDAKNRMVFSDVGHSKFLSGKPVPVVNRIKVRASSTFTVPPNSLMFVTGAVETGRNNDHKVEDTVLSGLLEPYNGVRGLLTAEALCFSEDGKVPVRVLNMTKEPIVLHKRKLLGFLDPSGQTAQFVSAVKIVQRIVTGSTSDIAEAEVPEESHVQPSDCWTRDKLFKELKIKELDATSQERGQLKAILWKHKEVFSKHEFDLGTCNFFKAKINLKKDAVPQYVSPIPTPYKQRDALQNHLQGLVKAGVIEEMANGENSRWNARVFLVSKPHQPGKFRFVADFRALNNQCLPDTYCLPNINTVTDNLAGSKFFSTFDLSKSFYQVDYDSESVGLTAFTANGKKYVFKKLVMGHLSSSSQFSRMVDQLLKTIPVHELAYFLDDLMIASNDVQSHLQRLDLLLTKLACANLKVMPSKCNLLARKVEFVGLTVSEHGVTINDGRVAAVKEIPAPRSLKECQKVMGFLNYNRKFVQGFAGLAKPIYRAMDKNGKFLWNKDCQIGFEEIKRRIAAEINLALPRVDDPSSSYVVTIDASEDGYGAELAQWQDGELRIVAYFSKSVPKHKKKWSQHKLEFECLIETLCHFALYIKGGRFLVKTDCLSLLSLERMFLNSNATMIRRLNKIADFTFDIQHIDGEANDTADFLSRYLYKRRTNEAATQTERTSEVIVQRVMVNEEPMNLEPTGQDSLSSQVPTEDKELGSSSESEVIINEDILTRDYCPVSHAECMDMSRVSLKSECLCDLPMRDQHGNNGGPQVKVVNEVKCVAQQLEISEILDKQKIMAEQNRDPVLIEVKRWLTEGKPEKLQRLRLPADMLTYWKQLGLITIRDGVLYKKWVNHNKSTKEIEIERYLALVPESLKPTVLDQYHSSLIAMHPGVENTCYLICQQFYWPRMKDEVELYVKSCVTCGGCKQPHHYLKAPLKHVITYEVNDAISIDHIIPTKEGATKRGYRWILSITDVFSGYVLALPCKTKRSEETIRLIEHKWCLRFGYPKEILADNDTSFTSEFFNEVCKYFKVKVTHGTPYKCASTSKAERSNKRINQALRVTLSDKQIQDWDLYLNFVSFALNGIRSRHTGFSANQIMFGKNLNTPLDLTLDGDPITLDTYASKKKTSAYQIYRTIRDIVVKARRHAALDFGYADACYNKKMQGPYFAEGDWAFSLIECPQHKFSKRWQGPFEITKKIDDHLYVIDLGSKEKLVNISKLKPYVKSKYSPSHLNVHAPEYTPQVSTKVTGEDKNNEERDGAEIEIITPLDQVEITAADNLEDDVVPAPHIPDTRDDDWELIDLPDADPVDTQAAPVQQRRYPVRNRRPPNFYGTWWWD